MKNSQEEKMPYLSDGEIYSLWKYLNGFRFVGRNLLNFDDITAFGENKLFAAKFLNLLKDIGINQLKGLVFHKDLYLQYNKKSYEKLREKREKGELNPYNIKALGFLDKLLAGESDLIYENSYGISDFIFYENSLGFLEFFEFSINLKPRDKKKLENFIDHYIGNFVEDALRKDKNNFYHFNKQREILFRNLSSYEGDYGKSFILKYPKLEDYFIEPDKEYLFIHTLMTLEKLNYIEIERIWIFDMDLPPKEQTEYYKVKINLENKYFDEEDEIMQPLFPKKRKSAKNTKSPLRFDDRKSSLSFNDKEVIISKTRNSNGHYLLKTIFQDKNKTWEFDEIANDWNDEYKKDDWARYYNAGYKVNEKVAKETTIKDFLDITNKTVGINKKYL